MSILPFHPTMVILNPNGREMKRHSGYRKGGPQGYVDYLKYLLKKESS